MLSGEAHHCDNGSARAFAYTSTDQKTEWDSLDTSRPDPCDLLLLGRSHFLKIPDPSKHHHIWGANVQIQDPVEDIQHQTIMYVHHTLRTSGSNFSQTRKQIRKLTF